MDSQIDWSPFNPTELYGGTWSPPRGQPSYPTFQGSQIYQDSLSIHLFSVPEPFQFDRYRPHTPLLQAPFDRSTWTDMAAAPPVQRPGQLEAFGVAQPNLPDLTGIGRSSVRPFNRLPNEIVQNICRMLAPRLPNAKTDNLHTRCENDSEWGEFFANRQALLRFGRTSKQLHDIVQPFLYEQILFTKLSSVVLFRMFASHPQNSVALQTVRQVSFLGPLDVVNDRQLFLQALESAINVLHLEMDIEDLEFVDFGKTCQSCDKVFPCGRIIGVEGVIMDLVSRLHNLEKLQLRTIPGTFLWKYFLFPDTMADCPISMVRPGTPKPIWPPPRLNTVDLVFPNRTTTVIFLVVKDGVSLRKLRAVHQQMIQDGLRGVIKRPDTFITDSMDHDSLLKVFSYIDKLANLDMVKNANWTAHVISLKGLAAPGKRGLNKEQHKRFLSWLWSQLKCLETNDICPSNRSLVYDISELCSGCPYDREWLRKVGLNLDCSNIDSVHLKLMTPFPDDVTSLWTLEQGISQLPRTVESLELRLNLPSAVAERVYGPVGSFDMRILGTAFPALQSLTITTQALFGRCYVLRDLGYLMSVVDLKQSRLADGLPPVPLLPGHDELNSSTVSQWGQEVFKRIPATIKMLRVIDYCSEDEPCLDCWEYRSFCRGHMGPYGDLMHFSTLQIFVTALSNHCQYLTRLETVVFETNDQGTLQDPLIPEPMCRLHAMRFDLRVEKLKNWV